jgi:hypothetical protein
MLFLTQMQAWLFSIRQDTLKYQIMNSYLCDKNLSLLIIGRESKP